jgi:peptidyl-prolyl cis-trans isomerase A (cyclophilin A)
MQYTCHATTLIIASGFIITGCATNHGSPAPSTEHTYVRVTTTAGDMIIELDPRTAPISTANFLSYAGAGAYDGTIFHRVIAGFVIQGGGYTPELQDLPSNAPIKLEWPSTLKNQRGTIAWARDAAPDTATREFFINTADNAKLDTARDVSGNAGYAVFGRVIEGIDVVDKIRLVPTTTRTSRKGEEMKDCPIDPIVITSVRIVDSPRR